MYFRVYSNGVPDSGTAATHPFAVPAFPAAPGIFRVGYDCKYPQSCDLTSSPSPTNVIVRGAITDQKGVVVSSKNPMLGDAFYSMYLTGLQPLDIHL